MSEIDNLVKDVSQKAEETARSSQNANEDKVIRAWKDLEDIRTTSGVLLNLSPEERAQFLRVFSRQAGKAMAVAMIDEMMDKALVSLQKKYTFKVNTQEYKDMVRSVIFGHKQIQISQQDFIEKIAIKAAERIQEVIESRLDKAANRIRNKVNRTLDKADLRFERISTKAIMKTESIRERFDFATEVMENMIAESNGNAKNLMTKKDFVEKYMNKIMRKGDKLIKFANRVDFAMAILGVDIKGKFLSDHISDFYKKQSINMQLKLGHLIKNQIGRVKKVQAAIHHIEKQIKKYKEQVQKIINSWKSKANEFLDAQVAKIKSRVGKEIGNQLAKHVGSSVKLRI